MKTISGKNNLQIIYLDQFASVGLFESETKEWKRIKELIKFGVESKKIICPLSLEHYIETSQKDKSKAAVLDTEFYKISGGYAFKSELHITPQLIISLIRGNNTTIKTFLHDEIFKDVLSNSEKLDIFIDAKNQFLKKTSEATIVVNEIRKITREDKSDYDTKQLMISALKSVSVNEFISRLKDLLKDGYIRIRGIPFESGDIPHWIDQFIFQLVNNKKMTKSEVILLVSELERNGFNNIPTLDIRTSLSAIISFYNKNETVNDHIDIMRISSGLPISDIFFTDKQRKNEIIELGLDKKYCTNVYSGTIIDLDRLIGVLEEII